MELKIIEANGWTKVVPVNRAITRVGRAVSNDIPLPATQIAPFQLQILSTPDLPSGCRIVNMSGDLLLWRNHSENQISAFQVVDIFDGDELGLGDYRLVFHLPLASTAIQTSRSIEAALVFTEAVLHPDSTLAGSLRVKNAGSRQGVQFQVSLAGLPHDCYQIDPIPLMYPGAEEEVQVRLFHRTQSPAAGMHELLLTVSAPDDYSGEDLIIRQGIYVTPVLRQELTILDSYAPPAPVPERTPAAAVPLTLSYAVPGVSSSISTPSASSVSNSSNPMARSEEAPASTAAVEASPDASQAAATPTPTPNPTASPAAPGQPKVKVVRTEGTAYWDE